MANWWNDATTDPKRQYRFILTIGGGIEKHLIKTVTKPSMTISSTPHVYLTHTFNFPGKVTWDDITVTLIDAGTNGGKASTNILREMITKAGYVLPENSEVKSTISKNKMVGAAMSSTFAIEQINADGTTIEKWTLHNPIITKVSNGNLSYASEDLVELSLTIKYDYAVLS